VISRGRSKVVPQNYRRFEAVFKIFAMAVKRTVNFPDLDAYTIAMMMKVLGRKI
jgi:hypothetical protein